VPDCSQRNRQNQQNVYSQGLVGEVADIELQAINSTCSPQELAHLLQYDTVHGKWSTEVHAEGNELVANGRRVTVISERNPELLPWREYGIELAVDATGIFWRITSTGSCFPSTRSRCWTPTASGR
jgi:glyceraldehyde-3-phosphate dehydrogenase/erythrose-4-phosphate dehydrogenase